MWANPLCLLAPGALCQTPPSPPTTCRPGYHLGRDEVVTTYAHPFRDVFPLINSFKDLTWSFVPPSQVTLNGTNNVPYTSRRYTVNGFNINETLQYYQVDTKLLGPYQQVHEAARLSIPQGVPEVGGLDLYIPYDDMVLKSECAGFASSLNLTAVYCANKPAVAGAFLHSTHLAYERNVERLLGGKRFKSCGKLGLPLNVTVAVEVEGKSKRELVDREMARNGSGVSSWSSASAAAAVGAMVLSLALGLL